MKSREAAHEAWRSVGAPTAAAAVVMVPGLILVERGPKGNKPPGLPGGKREPGETTVETALRELREETGVEGRACSVLLTTQAGLHLCDIVIVHTFASPNQLPLGCTWEHPALLLKQSRYPDVYATVFAHMLGWHGYPAADCSPSDENK